MLILPPLTSRNWPRWSICRTARRAPIVSRACWVCAISPCPLADSAGQLAFHETQEKGHDRFERRRASVVAAPADAPRFPGLAAFGRIESERRVGKKKSSFFTHYIALSKCRQKL